MEGIPLRARGGEVRAVTFIDDEDYEPLSRFRWSLRTDRYGKRYAQRPATRSEIVAGRPRTILMHRAIMDFPGELVDHIDGDGLNNQRTNLRVANEGLNSWNRKGADRDNSTGFRGVTRARNGFIAHATVNGVTYRLGRYATAEEANEVVTRFRAEVPDLVPGAATFAAQLGRDAGLVGVFSF